MTNEEIINLENENTSKIILLKRGAFWHAYEHSAWFFVKEIRHYQVSKKTYKNLHGQSLLELGFNESVLEDVIAGHVVEYKGDKKIVLKAKTGFDRTVFLEWKDGFDAFIKQRGIEKEVPVSVTDSLREELRNFDLVNKTPYECMQMLVKLKAML